jgi:hypothetical protein
MEYAKNEKDQNRICPDVRIDELSEQAYSEKVKSWADFLKLSQLNGNLFARVFMDRTTSAKTGDSVKRRVFYLKSSFVDKMVTYHSGSSTKLSTLTF